MKVSDKVKKAVLGTWYDIITRQWNMERILDVTLDGVIKEFKKGTVYPLKRHIFRSMLECSYDTVRVVFIGQDPYHDGKATGLAFANEEEPLSPSLRILKEEWEDNQNGGTFDHTLISWAQQGVLLLNTALTVREGEPKSHFPIWELWTKRFIRNLSKEKSDLLYVMFGKKAQAWEAYIEHGHVLHVVHPAAETYAQGGAGFYGCKFYDKVNNQLKTLNQEPIIW